MELKLQAMVTLDATPALIGALDRMADAMKGGEAAPKSRSKAAKKPEPEPAPEPGEKPAEASPAAAAPAASVPAAPVTPAPAAAPAAAPSPAPAVPTGAVKGIGAEEARRVLIAIVQKHGCGDALQKKLHELGYQTQYAMADDVRADFVAWARQTYPISDAEVL